MLEVVKNKPKEKQIVFIKAWNEWGEGNYMEPDLKYGRGMLEALKEAIQRRKKIEIMFKYLKPSYLFNIGKNINGKYFMSICLVLQFIS